jgi:hypothetical protein
LFGDTSLIDRRSHLGWQVANCFVKNAITTSTLVDRNLKILPGEIGTVGIFAGPMTTKNLDDRSVDECIAEKGR